MGPRPADFDEDPIKQSPTFAKWLRLEPGEKLRYACRDFIRGHEQDEERLMRRIMIARRNNLKDHEILKRARKTQDGPAASAPAPEPAAPTMEPPPLVLPNPQNETIKEEAGAEMEDSAAPTSNGADSTTSKPTSGRKRRPASTFSDTQVAKEMDVPAVEATRSYKSWMALDEGAEFVYNQKYVKGKEGHDWLLRKNIWRRMRYRRENKKMVTQLKEDDPSIELVKARQSQKPQTKVSGKAASDIVDSALSSLTTEGKKRGTASRRSTRNGGSGANSANNQRSAAAATEANKQAATNKRSREETAKTGKAAKMPKLESDATPPPLEETIVTTAGEHPVPDLPPPVVVDHHHAMSPPEEEAALTAAAAATASGADDLVELPAVETAVAAAANYVQLATQQQQQQQHEDDGDDESEVDDDLDETPANVVHNPLEAAANAAALDSAAKLAAAAQMNQEDDEEPMPAIE